MATGLDLIREENPALALIPDDELIEIILEDKFSRDVVFGSKVVNLCSLIYNNTV